MKPALVPLLTGGCALALYVASLPPTFAFWDTGELQTVASILGIAHPPAAPVFVLLGWLFVHVLPLGDDAWRVNFTCALAVSVAVGLLYATMRRVAIPPIVAALCTFGFAAASVPWQDATRAEVQDVALLGRVAALFFALRWSQSGKRRDLVFTGLCFGLAAATHGIAVLLLPALIPLVARASRRPDMGGWLVLAGSVVLGLLPYVYLPLRSAAIARAHLDPTVALGLPVGMPFWNYDDPQTWPNFLRVVTGADFDVHSGFAGFAQLGAYPRFAAALVKQLVAAYGFVGCALAGIGAALLVARRRAAGLALVVAALLPVPYTESYNELQDPSRYYLLTLWCSAIAIGAGFEFVADLLALVPRSIGRFALAGLLVASFVSASPDRAALFAQRDNRNAPRYVSDVIATTPSNAIVVAEWAYATPLAYAAYVQHALGERVVVSASPTQFVALYRRWLRTRPVYIVSFNDALTIPGFVVTPLGTGYYHEYHLASAGGTPLP
ncbi:MAG: DUF2723 domain-containing protein [Candidatus Eremiobacteraeota bacterium]|nr:DUF2723 domain-containing protein [Candidatus Eremiobacteraeota bacterium]MBC5801736.1 DUF2723 domain-containing protein [Candidatus Eremiobacteraeota bacterium]MBC5821516.1 DUF2723 domain-containing protein [Candidatus Eremiobacteraeota bacterium]